MELFTIHCPTCGSRLRVRDRAAIGAILACPRCQSMVEVQPPPGWQPSEEAPSSAVEGSPRQTASPGDAASLSDAASPGDTAANRALTSADTSAAAPFAWAAQPERRVQRAVLAATALLLVALAIATTWALWSNRRATMAPVADVPSDANEPAAAAAGERPQLAPREPAAGRQGTAASSEAWATGDRLDRRWLPDECVAIVDIELPPGAEGDLLRGLLFHLSPPGYGIWSDLVRGLMLAPGDVRRLTVAVTTLEPHAAGAADAADSADAANPGNAADAAVVRIELGIPPAAAESPSATQSPAAVESPSAVDSLIAASEPLDWSLGEYPARRTLAGGWPHPWVLVDERTIVTGPRTLLRSLTDEAAVPVERVDGPARTEPSDPAEPVEPRETVEPPAAAPSPAALAPWIDARDTVAPQWATTAIAGFTCWVNLEALNASLGGAGGLPWLELLGGDLGTLAQSSPAVAVRLTTTATGIELECHFACAADDGDATQQLADELVALAARASELPTELVSEPLSQLAAAPGNLATTKQLQRLLVGLRLLGATARVEREGQRVRLTASAAVSSTAWLAALVAATGAWEEPRLAASQAGDDLNHSHLAVSVSQAAEATGHFPSAAAGSPLVPPQQRLSWIATMLPYLGHPQWYEALNFARSWNSSDNRPVTRRVVEELLHPALGDQRLIDGFPATHYVGLAGVGDDALTLPSSHPRAGVFGDRPPLARGQIVDGLSQTAAFAGVVAQIGPWAAGGTATVRALTAAPYVNGPDGLGSGRPDGMLVGMADGSVLFISFDVDPRVMEALVTIAGGESIDFEQLDSATPDVADARHAAEVADESDIAGGPDAPRVPDGADGSEGRDGDRAPPAGSDRERPAGENHEPARSSILPDVDVARQLALPLAHFEVERMPLVEWIALVERLAAVYVTLDVAELAIVGVSPLEPVSLRLEATTPEGILAAALGPLGLAAIEVDHQLVVVARALEGIEPQTATVDLSDLLAPGLTAEQVARLIVELVEPASWREAGGAGRLQVTSTGLLLEQTPRVAAKVRDTCDRWRAARRHVGRGEPLPPESAWTQTRALRETAVKANFFAPLPLVDLIDWLRAAAGGALVVDWKALLDAGFEAGTPVELQAAGRPLAEVLDQLLQPLGLTWIAVDGPALAITSQQAAREAYRVEWYDLAAWSPPGAAGLAPEEAARRLAAAVEPDSWGPGRGVWRLAPASGLVGIRQSSAVHRLIAEQLGGGSSSTPAE